MELRSVIIQAGSRRSSAEIDLNAVFAIHTTSDCCFLGDRLQSGRLPYAVSAMHVCLVCDVGVLWPNGSMTVTFFILFFLVLPIVVNKDEYI